MSMVDDQADPCAPLGEREAEIMGVLWTVGSGTVGEVRAGLSDQLAYTTVLTILRNLEKKGFLSHKAEGRAHRYSPRVARREATREALDRLLGAYFRNSAEALVSYMAGSGMIGRKDLKRIRRELKREDGGNSGRSKKRRKKKGDKKAGPRNASPSLSTVDRNGSSVELPPDTSAGQIMTAVVLDRE